MHYFLPYLVCLSSAAYALVPLKKPVNKEIKSRLSRLTYMNNANRRVTAKPIQMNKGKPLVVKAKKVAVEDMFDIITYNLDRRSDRWEKMQTAMEEQGLKIERFSAVDGKVEFKDNQYMVEKGLVSEKALKNNKFLTKGAVAIGLTSRQVWEKCKMSSKPYTIILQDDLLIEPDFKHKLEDLTTYIQDYPFDVLMLHQNVYNFWLSDESRQNNAYNAEWIHRDNPAKIVPTIFGFSAAGYIIDNKSSQKLLDAYTLPIDTNADMFWYGTYSTNKSVYPSSHKHILTENTKADNITVMQTHPLWYKNLCATSSQCTDGDTRKKDSEVISSR